MFRTYLITEICKAAENVPTWLGWTLVGVLAAASITLIGAIAYIIWESRQ